MSTSELKIVVFITGYGPFATVKVNPSCAIALRVVEDLKRHADVADVRYTELDVSVKSVAEYFEKMESDIAEIAAEGGGSEVKILLCHLGVYKGTTGLLRVEVQGYNELFASITDVDGRALDHEPIRPEDGALDTFKESWFGKEGSPQLKKLQSLIQQLNENIAASWPHSMTGTATRSEVRAADSNRKEMIMPAFQPPSWVISRDAGRYLCNFALYRALRLQEKNPGIVYGIFIHVVDPTCGKQEVEGGPIVVYNPTTMVQSEQVKFLVRGLLTLMSI
ncbi:hypothetical protein LSCM1_02217 [Leishmania martiniquensis]|uniref:Pyroglutamyl-peptidase I (PGP) n=1 Tax=Leishmania martiniquensis TaxID=1580590 RepID=A0A836G829_9TRYP|nr:hypothetical protein LSCM1_02217 [Leishmania martiniquensis]